MSLELARAVADAVLYEGYLLYPYRATSRKNMVRWQFGVLGPNGASAAGIGEEPAMEAQCVLSGDGEAGSVTVHLRFLQLQTREVERLEPAGDHVPVDEISVGDRRVLTWDEAVEHEITIAPYALKDLRAGISTAVEVGGGDDVEVLSAPGEAPAGRIVRRRWPLRAEVRLTAEQVDGFLRLSARVQNVHDDPPHDKDDAIRRSLIGAHLLIEADGADFVSLLDPPEAAADIAASCHQHRCWPVLAGAAGESDLLLVSPIILYDHPEVAAESAGDLFDSTEIDEILTLRVMTLTDDEKAEARATDPRAEAIIDRCDQMSPETLNRLHGILRSPHLDQTDASVSASADGPAGTDIRNTEPPSFDTGEVPWWDPATDAAVQPEVDAVTINGVSVCKGSLVRVHPSRRADAQDLFFADQDARVTAVLSDVDGDVHVAVVLVDDPAADLHDWYGRYLYFAPEELEPLGEEADVEHREESRS
ncbi:MAG: hypothetical protein H0U28_06060 [Nocardioidaceae bacterium]|nr:hypothetical protein [Nocardioidaceae bacterium]